MKTIAGDEKEVNRKPTGSCQEILYHDQLELVFHPDTGF